MLATGRRHSSHQAAVGCEETERERERERESDSPRESSPDDAKWCSSDDVWPAGADAVPRGDQRWRILWDDPGGPRWRILWHEFAQCLAASLLWPSCRRAAPGGPGGMSRDHNTQYTHGRGFAAGYFHLHIQLDIGDLTSVTKNVKAIIADALTVGLVFTGHRQWRPWS